jgi:hypothetical protein
LAAAFSRNNEPSSDVAPQRDYQAVAGKLQVREIDAMGLRALGGRADGCGHERCGQGAAATGAGAVGADTVKKLLEL